MSSRKCVRHWLLPGLVGLAVVAVFAGRASANLLIDVRVDSVSGSLTKTDSWNVSASGTGDVILGLYAVPHDDSSGASDYLVMARGSVYEARGGGVHGNIVDMGPGGATLISPFNTAGQVGKLQDLNGDTDIDLGSTMAVSGTATDYFLGSSAPTKVNNANGAAGIEIAQVQYHVVAAGAGTPATIHFWPYALDSTGATWYEGGSTTASKKTPVTSGQSFHAGTVVTVSFGTVASPEPCTLVLLGMGAVGLILARRRRNH